MGQDFFLTMTKIDIFLARVSNLSILHKVVLSLAADIDQFNKNDIKFYFVIPGFKAEHPSFGYH